MNNNETVCCAAKEGMLLCGTQLIPAGGAAGERESCGFAPGRLPRVSFVNQNYTDGYCPDGALAVGTLFPCLTDVYK